MSNPTALQLAQRQYAFRSRQLKGIKAQLQNVCLQIGLPSTAKSLHMWLEDIERVNNAQYDRFKTRNPPLPKNNHRRSKRK